MSKVRYGLILSFVGVAVLLLYGCMSQSQRAALLKGPYTLQVDYSASLADALAAGRYGWTDSRLTPVNFPAPQAGTATLSGVLVQVSPEVTPEYLQTMAAPGMRPATLWELLAFGKAYPEVQAKLPVIGLGSNVELMVDTYEHDFSVTMPPVTQVVPRPEHLYPFLGGGIAGRIVGLEWLGDPGGYGMYYALFVKPQ